MEEGSETKTMNQDIDGYFADGEKANDDEESSCVTGSSASSSRNLETTKDQTMIKYRVTSSSEDDDDIVSQANDILKGVNRKRHRHKHKSHNHRHHHHKRRRHGEKLEDEQVKLAPSPIHPDIDISLTTQISFGGVNVCGIALGEEQKRSDHMVSLSGLISSYFTHSNNVAAYRKSTPKTTTNAAIATTQTLTKKATKSKQSSTSSPSVVSTSVKTPSSSSMSKSSAQNLAHKFPLRQLGTNTRLSSHHLFLDDVLSLNPSPR